MGATSCRGCVRIYSSYWDENEMDNSVTSRITSLSMTTQFFSDHLDL
jgi:hypothetical protein